MRCQSKPNKVKRRKSHARPVSQVWGIHHYTLVLLLVEALPCLLPLCWRLCWVKHLQPRKAVGLGGCSSSRHGHLHQQVQNQSQWIGFTQQFSEERQPMGYGSYWLHLSIFRGCSTLKSTLTATIARVLFSFPYTREGKELKKKLLSSLAQTSGCGAAPSGLLSETAGSTALLHLPALWHISAHICCKRAVCSLSRA